MSKFCPKCGEELVDSARFCKNCWASLEGIPNPHQTATGEYRVPVVEDDHKIAVIAGYVLAILLPLFGFIVGIYLLTRNSQNARKHGKYVMIVAAVLWIISFLL
jgi:uncharacterized membrane protein YvbJ